MVYLVANVLARNFFCPKNKTWQLLFSVTQRINKTTPWSSCFMAHLWLRDFMKVRE